MNDDLRNAPEQLKRGANKQYGTTTLWCHEAQALLDERDALREALEAILTQLGLYMHTDRRLCAKAHAALSEDCKAHTDWKAVAQAEVESFGRHVAAEEVRQVNESVKEHIIAALDKVRQEI